jgi:hypothetical protein
MKIDRLATLGSRTTKDEMEVETLSLFSRLDIKFQFSVFSVRRRYAQFRVARFYSIQYTKNGDIYVTN